MGEQNQPDEARVLTRGEHSISRKNIDETAIKVLYRLHRSGKRGYLVGGGVRDLLLSKKPKDFDVATDASPREVKRLFRNSRIIGRRFRLVHVFFRGETVEVSTFRRDPDRDAQRGGPDELLITDDNVFGTPREDAFRRDFTVNALFYNIADFTVIDFVGGIDDLEAALIRAIGDPDVRFREDPVRMLRACELAARLRFGIEAAAQQAMQRNCREIEKAAPARVTEELLQILHCGESGAALQWMLDLGLVEILLPEVHSILTASEARLGEFGGVFVAVDTLVRENRKLSDATLLGVLLLPHVLLERHQIETERGRVLHPRAVAQLIDRVVEPFAARFVLSRQRRDHMTHALNAFFGLTQSEWKPAARARFARRPYFEDAFSLCEILVRATGQGDEVLAPWRAVRKNRVDAPAKPSAPRKRRRRGGRNRRRRGPRTQRR